jgi:acetate kinase
MSSIAVIDAGSSSIKFAVFQSAATPSLLLRGQIEGIGTTPRAKLSDPRGKLLVEESFEDKGFDHAAATQAMMRIGAQWLGGGISRRLGTVSCMVEPNIRRRCS